MILTPCSDPTEGTRDRRTGKLARGEVKLRHKSVMPFRFHAPMMTKHASTFRRAMSRALLALLLAAVVAGSAAAEEGGTPIDLDSTRVRIDVENPEKTRIGELDFIAGVELSSSDERFGGFSGLLLTNEGRRLSAVSDRGFWMEAEVVHDADGALTEVTNARMGRLRGLNGEPMRADHHVDAEGLAILPDGDWLVSFERQHRFRRYPAGARPLAEVPRNLPKPPGIDDAPINDGMEALVTLADGRLLVFTEGLLDGQDRVVFLWQDQTWQRLRLQREGEYKPTGAALLPDGDVLLLERRWNPIGGLGIRVSRIRGADIAAGARLVPQELAVMRRPLTVDNMEGIEARRGRDGRTLIYMLSDDNYQMLQRTLLLQFAIRE